MQSANNYQSWINISLFLNRKIINPKSSNYESTSSESKQLRSCRGHQQHVITPSAPCAAPGAFPVPSQDSDVVRALAARGSLFLPNRIFLAALVLLVFSSISLCRVAFICGIYKTDKAPGTKDGTEWGKMSSKSPARNVPGVFCCEGKAMGVTEGLEMFRVAIYWMYQRDWAADTISKCLHWCSGLAGWAPPGRGLMGTSGQKLSHLEQTQVRKKRLNLLCLTSCWLLWWILYLWAQVFLTNNIRCFLQAQWCGHPCWD